MAEEKIPILFIELCDQRDSGFILDGTEGTPNEVQLKAPSVRFIPNVAFRRAYKTDKIAGKDVKTPYNERIVWVRSQTEISAEKLKTQGIVDNSLNAIGTRPQDNKIFIEKGFMTIAREGSNVGLYDYLSQAYYNESNVERSETATAIYKVIELDKQAEATFEEEMIAADAVKYVGTLYSKKAKGGYTYREDRINSICELLAIVADTMPMKIEAMLKFAKFRPELFLAKVTKLEQTTITEIMHALELNVIKLESNSAQYVTKEKIIKTFGTQKLSKDEQVEELADFLRTADGNAAYTELRAELDAAKEKALKN